MPGTVIDSLVVSLGLDASRFTKGQNDALGQLRRFESASSASSKKLDDQDRKIANERAARNKQFITDLTKARDAAIGLFAAFTAGKGLEAFARDTIAGNAALGRFATNIGVSVRTLSTWEGVVSRLGGNGAAVGDAFAKVSADIQNFQLTGQPAAEIPYFRTLGIALTDSKGKLRDLGDVLRDVLKALGDPRLSQPQRLALLSGTGFGIAAPLLGRTDLDQQLKQQQQLGVVTDGQAKAAQQAQSAIIGLGQAWDTVGRQLLVIFEPALEQVADTLTAVAEWASRNPRVVEAAFDGISTAAVLLGAAITAAFLPISGVAAAVAVATSALGGLFVYFRPQVERFGDQIGATLEHLGAFLGDAFDNALGGALTTAAKAIVAAGSQLLAAFKQALADPLHYIETSITDVLKRVFDAIRNAVGGLSNRIANAPGVTLDAYRTGADGATFQSASYEVPSSSGGGSGRYSALEQSLGLPPGLLSSVERTESGGNPYAVSSAGAQGAFQLEPGTARRYGVANPFDEGQSARGAAAFFADLLRHYGGDATKAIAAYNAGQGTVDRDVDQHGADWRSYLPDETARYIGRVTAGLGDQGNRYASAGGGLAGGSVSIGNVTVHTRATDAKGIARDLRRELVSQSARGLTT